MKKVCIIGCGAIGSLYAAHLARVAEVWALFAAKITLPNSTAAVSALPEPTTSLFR
jgi:ketopantoate reductase